MKKLAGIVCTIVCSLILAAELGAQQDSVMVIGRMPIPQTPVIVNMPEIPVNVTVGDSIAVALENVNASIQALAARECQCNSGPPWWFYSGILVVASYGAWQLHKIATKDNSVTFTTTTGGTSGSMEWRKHHDGEGDDHDDD